MKRTLLIEIICGLLILLFAYTGINKLMDVNRFRVAIQASPLIENKSFALAWIVPITELLIALLLFIPRFRLSGLYASSGLMLLFTIYVGYMLTTISLLPCSCGGIIQAMTWKQHLTFNIFFTILPAIGIWLSQGKPISREPLTATYT